MRASFPGLQILLIPILLAVGLAPARSYSASTIDTVSAANRSAAKFTSGSLSAATIGDAVAKCKAARDRAAECCAMSNQKACSAQVGQYYKKPEPTAIGGGSKDSCDQYQTQLSKDTNLATTVKHVCQGNAKGCYDACDEILKKPKDADCTGDCANSIQTIANYKKECGEDNWRNATTASNQIAEFVAASGMANQCTSTTQDGGLQTGSTDGSNTGSGSDTTDGGSADEGSGTGSAGLGQMAQMLLPLLGQMLTPEAPVPVTPFDFSACQDGSSPHIANCPAPAGAPLPENAPGNGGLQTASVEEPGFSDLNLPTPEAGTIGGGTPATPTANRANPIPGGTGMNVGGGGAAAAGGGNPQPGGSGYKSPDVQVSTASYGAYGGMDPKNVSTDPSSTSGYTNPVYDSMDREVDWRQWAPKGGTRPGRKLAGIGAPIQIQSKEVNIWARISSRYQSRCHQGLLRDCIP